MILNATTLVCYPLVLLSFGVFLSFLTPGVSRASLTVNFESPQNGEIVSGVAIIRGWAFDTDPLVKITRVEFLIDGGHQDDIPCCSERPDIQDAFPDAPPGNTLNSGFGLTFNW